MTPNASPRLAGLTIAASLLLLAVAGCPADQPTSTGLKPSSGRRLTQATAKPAAKPSGSASGAASAFPTLPPQGGSSSAPNGSSSAPNGSPGPSPSPAPSAAGSSSPGPTPTATATPTPTPSATRTPRPSSGGGGTSGPTSAPTSGLQIVDTLAGGTQGYADGTGAAARFDTPRGLALDPQGNLYVADSANHRVRMVTPTGEVSTIVGAVQGFSTGNGTNALLNAPEGVAVAADGKALYIADTGNHAIRKVDLVDALHPVTTLAGGVQGYQEGTGEAAQLDAPAGLAVDAAGMVWVADTGNHALRQITPAGEVSTITGGVAGYIDSTYPGARFLGLTDIVLNAAGVPFVADAGNHVIRRVALAGAAVETLAGDGTAGALDASGDNAKFSGPRGVAIDASGNLYVADRANHRIRMVTAAGVVTTFAGDVEGAIEGPVTSARFREPSDVAVSGSVIYVADTLNHRIRVIKAP